MGLFLHHQGKKSPGNSTILVLKYRGNNTKGNNTRQKLLAKLLHPLGLNLGNPTARFRRGNIGVDMGIGDAGDVDVLSSLTSPLPGK